MQFTTELRYMHGEGHTIILSVFSSLIRTFLIYCIWEHQASRELSSQCSLCFGQEAIPLSEKNRTGKGHFVKSCSVCSTCSAVFHFLGDGDSRKKCHSLSLVSFLCLFSCSAIRGRVVNSRSREMGKRAVSKIRRHDPSLSCQRKTTGRFFSHCVFAFA